MTILCAGDCHVWLGSSSLCTCEAHRGPSGPTLAMYGFPQNYNPFAPTRATPPTAADLPAVDVARLRLAELAGAGWLSADGQRIYCERFDAVFEAKWDGDRFGSWWACERVAEDAVRL